MSHPPSIRHLRDYVAIPSVNPMRRSGMSREIAGEARYAEHLREQLRRLGVDAELIGGDPQRPSVVAEARASGATETLMVASHLDTVPVDGMEIDPFDPVVEDGLLYGRGSCDTKGGMAALIAALERVLAAGTLRRNLVLVGEADEELGSAGAHDVVRHLAGRPPDWAIATEPTGLRVVSRHKGIAIAQLVARGRACHSSNPAAGKNAIVALARAVLALDALGHALRDRPDPHLGPATLSVGLIDGGAAPNIVPERATLVSDRRLLPGEDEDSVRRELEAALAEHRVSDVEIASVKAEKPALATPEDSLAVRACQGALAAAGLPRESAAVAFGTDAGIFSDAGVPCVVLGPGSIDLAHTSREHVPVAEVEAMTELFVRLLEGA